jgi:hypothetical protein
VGHLSDQEIRVEWLRVNESCLEIPDFQHTVVITSDDVFVRDDSNKNNQRNKVVVISEKIRLNLIRLTNLIAHNPLSP